MKNKCIVLFAFFAASQILAGERSNEEEPDIEWVDAKCVYIHDDVVTTDTNKGIAHLQILQFDEEKNRYLVEYLNKMNSDTVN